MSALLDTSVIVRYITGDSEFLSELSARIVDGDEQSVVTDVMLAESWFVLTRVYGVPRESATDQLIALLRKPNLETYPLDKDLAIEALLLCRPSGRFSIADALLWATARMRGEPVRTFDRRFPGDGIELLTPAGGA